MSLSSRSLDAKAVSRERKIETAKNPRGTLLRLLQYFAPYKASLAGIVLLVLIAIAATISGPYLIGYSIDNFITTGDTRGLLRTAILMAGFFAAGWLADSVSGVLTAKISQKALKAIRKDLFEHLQTLSIRFFDHNPHGELMSRLTNDIDAINQAISQNIIQLFSSILTLAGVLVAMFFLNIWLALTCMVAIPMMLLVGRGNCHTRKSFRSLQNEIGTLNGLMEENISGLREVKIFHRNQTALETFDTQNKLVSSAGIRAQTLAFLMMPLMTVLSNLNIAIVAGVGSWMAIQVWLPSGKSPVLSPTPAPLPTRCARSVI